MYSAHAYFQLRATTSFVGYTDLKEKMAFPFSICIPETEILSFLGGAFSDHKETVRLRHYNMCENARRRTTTLIIWIFF